MSYEVKMLADSISPDGVRLVTQQVTFPRFILAEVNTHRVFSRSSASSRAIPVEKNIDRVLREPFVPAAFGANQKGMQAGTDLDAAAQDQAHYAWLEARDTAASAALDLAKIGVHKQWANRLIEPFAWHTAIITASAWENWDNLRDNPQASPEIQVMARMMKESRAASTPRKLAVGEWHLPLVEENELMIEDTDDFRQATMEERVKFSVARCARVSYLTHDGKRDVQADLALYYRLVSSGHMSPLEHAAKVAREAEVQQYALYTRSVETVYVDPETQEAWTPGRPWVKWTPVCIGNLAVPWLSHRKMIPGEAVFASKET